MKEDIADFIKHHRHPDKSLDFDGIFVNTDYNAYLTCRILKDMGYRIPDDVQIIGFDGISKFSISDELFVSSICQPIPELAQTCVNMVLSKDKNMLPSLTLLPVHYKYGGTTKKA